MYKNALIHSIGVSWIFLSIGIMSCSDNMNYLGNDPVEVKFYAGQSIEDPTTTRSAVVDSIGTFSDGDMTISMKAYERPDKYMPTTKTSWTSANNTTTWQIGDDVGIYMRLTSGTPDATVDRNNVMYTTTTSTNSSPLTTVEIPSLYFPHSNTTNVNFYAYYPYSNGTNPALSPVQFPSPASMQTTTLSYILPLDQSLRATVYNADLMSARALNRNKTNPNVTLPFGHKMTLMTFAIKTGNALNNRTLTKVELSGNKITNAGTLNLTTAGITRDLTSTNTFYANVNRVINKSSLFYVDIIVNPFATNNSNNGNGEVLLELTVNGNTYKTGLVSNNKTFAGATRYVYTITVGS